MTDYVTQDQWRDVQARTDVIKLQLQQVISRQAAQGTTFNAQFDLINARLAEFDQRMQVQDVKADAILMKVDAIGEAIQTVLAEIIKAAGKPAV